MPEDRGVVLHAEDSSPENLKTLVLVGNSQEVMVLEEYKNLALTDRSCGIEVSQETV